MARIGGTDFFGKYSYVITFFGLFMLIADFGMASILGKDLAQVKEHPGSYWGNYLMVRYSLCGVTIILSIVTAYFIRRDLFLVLLAGSLALPFLSARFFEPLFQVYKRPWFSMWSSISYGVSYFALLSTALFLLPLSVTSAVMAYYLRQRILCRLYLSARPADHYARIYSQSHRYTANIETGLSPGDILHVRPH